ncbi:unnamed protein product [Amoebophrya sp. A120]|nr:unnamed protein product [Amoebophrya sp. A120]|eukprot:GSA120T00012524001.1
MGNQPASEVGSAASSARSSKRFPVITLGSTLEFRANQGKEDDMLQFLVMARDAVAQTEKEGTQNWYGVRYFPIADLGQKPQPDRFGIVDFFVDEAAQGAHFSGEVPNAVAANDQTEDPIVQGGLDAIVASHRSWRLLTNPPKLTEEKRMKHAKFLSFIPIRAGSEEQVEALKELLFGGFLLVSENEKKTSFWAACQNENDPLEFAIIDTFDSIGGVYAHFVEPALVPSAVQAALVDNPDLIEGGWEIGVVANIRVFQIVASKTDYNAGPSATKTAKRDCVMCG